MCLRESLIQNRVMRMSVLRYDRRLELDQFKGTRTTYHLQLGVVLGGLKPMSCLSRIHGYGPTLADREYAG